MALADRCCRSKMSCKTSIASCAAGRGTSATETPPTPSTRSRPRARTPGWLHRQASQPQRPVRLVGRYPPVTGPTGADQPRRNHRRAATQPAVASGSRMLAVKNVEEPCTGKPHARIERGTGRQTRLGTAPLTTNAGWACSPLSSSAQPPSHLPLHELPRPLGSHERRQDRVGELGQEAKQSLGAALLAQLCEAQLEHHSDQRI
jgi:hypothetical protein